jgi:hypothetical protein
MKTPHIWTEISHWMALSDAWESARLCVEMLDLAAARSGVVMSPATRACEDIIRAHAHTVDPLAPSQLEKAFYQVGEI